MADALKPTPEQEESRLNQRTSALDWFMNPAPRSRCSPSLETSDDKRIDEMKAMLRSRPVSTESRFIKGSDAPKPVALNQKKWAEFPLEQRIDINHNTRRLRFRLPVEDLGLPVGMHIFLKGKVDGKPVMRAYTPVAVGPYYVDFVIKVYFPLPPKFPDGGVLTQHFETLKVGDTIDFKGPLGEFDFDCAVKPGALRDTISTFKTNGAHGGNFKHLGMIAGGSGITPVLQVATALLLLDRDFTVSILYANQSPEDILCQEELDAVAKDPRVKVWYTVDRAPEGWKYSTGFISEDMIRDHLPAASEHTYTFMCGPPPMLKFACRPNLDKLGHAEDHVLAF
uniref:NADH-cytochrome b5 reductase n=1 Tax=Phaeocystis antarctica TaxID=33657 RepID=A0A7S0EJI5_9EUKA